MREIVPANWQMPVIHNLFLPFILILLGLITLFLIVFVIPIWMLKDSKAKT